VAARGAERRAAGRLPGSGGRSRAPGEGLPQDDADRPDVRRTRRALAVEAFGGDVRERAGHVARSRERLGLGELSEPEVEHAHGHVVCRLEHDVRRLDVTVHDALRVRVAERLEHLRGGLHGSRRVELPAPERVPQGRARDVGIGHIDVALVAGERERPQAARMPKPRPSLDLALHAGAGLALERDHFERDVSSRLLVANEPNRARAAAPERPERPVAPEHEVVVVQGKGAVHPQHKLGFWAANSCNRRGEW
jgi:hypothetical protein